ncbi:MAG: hypothetical protein JXX28_17300 [Deltaproteobacteria bacterium]|nr:hypothetical protein [Deltaproteobacteria bacterium]
MPRQPLLILLSLSACDIENNLHPILEPVPLPISTCDPALDIHLPEDEADRPVAVCSAESSVIRAIHERTTLHGERSYDANGGQIVEYRWKLVEAPEASTAALQPGPEDFLERLSPDLVGTYLVELQVVNDACALSDPCLVSVSAIADADLWVEMFWDHRGEDMDLHLLRPGAQQDSQQDCYYGNCIAPDVLDWDVHGLREDDPHLDLDDIDGMGPENINITAPGADRYVVAVHDYPGSVREAATEVTVRVYLMETLAFEETRTIRGEGALVRFAEVNMATGTVQPL